MLPASAPGMEPLFLLLWWGDLAAARAGFTKVLDAHKRMLARVRQGEATAGGTCAPIARITRLSNASVCVTTGHDAKRCVFARVADMALRLFA